MSRAAPPNRSRYRTLLLLESVFPPDGDHGMLIVPACQILETELHDRLLTPARHVAAELVAALEGAGDARQAAILGKWRDGAVPATIGVCCIALLACARAVERGNATVSDFLGEEFRTDYLSGIRGNRLGRALDRVRVEFRNPACHGTATFDGARYAAFLELLVACATLGRFDAAIVPSADGLLVSHLLYHTGGFTSRKSRAGA